MASETGDKCLIVFENKRKKDEVKLNSVQVNAIKNVFPITNQGRLFENIF